MSGTIIMTAEALAERHLEAALKFRTVYAYAMYGWQITDDSIARKAAQNLNGWYTKARVEALKKHSNQSPPVWGFDCVNLTKGILWGWTGDASKPHGGAAHLSRGVPDVNADGMIKKCLGASGDFSAIRVGEGLWMPGHWGLYVGSGLCVECTSRWSGGVQITSVWNIRKTPGYNGRYWMKHGHLPWIRYGAEVDAVEREKTPLGSRLIREGTVGDDVRDLQSALLSLGYELPRFGADGEAGEETLTAVRLFQEDHGLEPDGVVGKDTLAALRAARSVAPPDPAARYQALVADLTAAQAERLRMDYPRAVVERM